MILICFGTRPEYIKIKPILQEFKKNNFINFKILFTGQHEDLVSLEDLIIDYKLSIENGTNRLDSIFCSLLNKEQIFDGITHVLVQGDTASAAALALAAFHRKIDVVHLEAGLRTHDIANPYPEEFYRRMISNMSSINFCVSEINREWLEKEKCPGINYVVGNTVLDNLNSLETRYENKILITLHRRENQEIMDLWFSNLEKLATKYKDHEFLLPTHPNPNVMKHISILKKVKVINALEHKEIIRYMSSCKLLITDSGGLQEESSFLKKKSIVCRKVTERVEGLNTFSFLCKDPSELEELFENLLTNYKINDTCPYGDGKSSEKIYGIINKII
jgi:UDP-N-acetylglucosamine 2-epimerase (non-hydrolysing)